MEENTFPCGPTTESLCSNPFFPTVLHVLQIRKQKISETDSNRAREKAISENIHAITSGISRIESMHTRIFKEKVSFFSGGGGKYIYIYIYIYGDMWTLY